MAEPVRIGEVSDLGPGEARAIDSDLTGTDDWICLARTAAGEFCALNDTCSHALASLAEGWVEGDTIECPLHGAAFSLHTGAALSLPATEPVATHRLEIRGEEIWLLPDGSPADGDSADGDSAD